MASMPRVTKVETLKERRVAKRPALQKSLSKTQSDAASNPTSLLKSVRGHLGLSQPEMGRVLGLSVRTICALETCRKAPTTDDERRIRECARLEAALAQVMKSEALGEWLRRPNDLFDGFKPIELIERGESDRLWRMVFQIQAGGYS
jgi:DNA-binding XRE family transcriptional regulator